MAACFRGALPYSFVVTNAISINTVSMLYPRPQRVWCLFASFSSILFGSRFVPPPPIVVGIEVVCLLLLLLTHLRARFKCDRQTRAASILKFEFCFVLCREDEDAGHVTTSRRSSPTTQSPSSLTTPMAFSRYLSRWLRVCREMEYF